MSSPSPSTDSNDVEKFRTVSDFLTSETAETVKIYVGPKRKLWILNEALLCARATYFASAFHGGLRESIEKELYLPEDNPSTFSRLVDWLYGQPLACTVAHKRWSLRSHDSQQDSKETLSWQPHDMALAEIYIMADKFGITILMEDIVRILKQCIKGCVRLPSLQVTRYVYENTTADSSLRHCIEQQYLLYFLEYTSKYADFKWADFADLELNQKLLQMLFDHLHTNLCGLHSCVAQLHGRRVVSQSIYP